LLERPVRRGMCRDIDVQDAAGCVFHEHEDIQETEGVPKVLILY
jgi:hypothetical protein